MSVTKTATHAPYIAKETGYAGKYQRTGIPAGMRVSYFAAAELADLLGSEGTFWEFHGHTLGGSPLFGRTRYVANECGDLAVYNSDGGLVLIHPADRKIGVLSR